MELSPNRTAFLTFRTLVLSGILIFFGLIGFFIANILLGWSLWHLVAFTALIAAGIPIIYLIIKIQFKKERYVMTDTAITYFRGGPFSDARTELNVVNITHVSLILPFIENSIFSTGTLVIQSAGSKDAEVVMKSIDRPREIHNKIIALMRKNGFSLRMDKEDLYREPNTLGVFFETFKTLFGQFLSAILFIYFMFADMSGLLKKIGVYPLFFLLAGLAFFLFIKAFLNFLDLSYRRYILYKDTIRFYEGFLTKYDTIIPLENLSRATVTQSFIDKVFGLHDIIVSCQGTQNEIHFKNIDNGQEMAGRISSLIKKAMRVNPEKAALHLNRYKTIFKMDAKRTFIPILAFLPLLPIYVFLLIRNLIEYYSTSYLISEKSVKTDFQFLSGRTVEFGNDKITGIVFEESLIDKPFGTCRIRFWSIGSSETLLFKNLPKEKIMKENILENYGIRKGKGIETIHSSFNLGNMIRKEIMILPILSTILVISAFFHIVFPILLLLMLACVYAYLVFYYDTSCLTFFPDHIRMSKGILVRKDYYVLYPNIKDVTITRYPWSDFGTILFNVAGEEVISTKDNVSIQSYNFTINHSPRITEKLTSIDSKIMKLCFGKELKPNTLFSGKPALQNSLVFFIPGSFAILAPAILFSNKSVFILPTALLAIISILLYIVASLHMTSYTIESSRVILRKGILTKSQKSTLFRKIDHINSTQGILNKVFDNGNVSINTTGSSIVELYLYQMPNYKEFYEILKKHYKQP